MPKKPSKAEGGNEKPQGFKMGGQRERIKEQAEKQGYKPQDDKLLIVVGGKETFETKVMREDIKKKAQVNYEQ